MSTLVKPRLRGVSHEIGFFAALVGGAWLVAASRDGVARAVTGVYAVALALMLGVSARYHRGTRGERGELRWKRADHSMIFVFVAGTYTPLCVLGIGGTAGMHVLVLVWIGALLGALRALFWVRAPRFVATGFYVALGWLGLAYWPAVRQSIATTPLRLIGIGGILYTVGAIVYATRKPDPYPRWFGYHEVFHVFVIAACVCHFLAISQLAGALP